VGNFSPREEDISNNEGVSVAFNDALQGESPESDISNRTELNNNNSGSGSASDLLRSTREVHVDDAEGGLEEAPNLNSLLLSLKMTASRALVGGLALPSLAFLWGKLYSKRFSSFQRSMLGGLTYLLFKILLKNWYFRQRLKFLKSKKVLNWKGKSSQE
jgi:hypothetical protein